MTRSDEVFNALLSREGLLQTSYAYKLTALVGSKLLALSSLTNLYLSYLLRTLYIMPTLATDEEPTKWGTATETSAARYSQTNKMQRGAGSSLSTKMNISKGQHVLVVACGPGNDVLDIADIVGPSGRVVGFDLDKHSINRAREALEKHPHLKSYVEVHVTDVHDLSMFAGQKFDAIHCNMSYHWFSDKPKFLAQAATLAKPGTVIGIETEDGTHKLPAVVIRNQVLAEIGEEVTEFVHPPTPAQVRHDLSTAGFGDVETLAYYGTYVQESAEALWDWMNDSSGNSFGNYLEEGPRKRMKDRVVERLRRELCLEDGRAVFQFKHLSVLAYYGR
jgi:ubiquinone/menaquinone biosynthesis C-methylase UbiE